MSRPRERPVRVLLVDDDTLANEVMAAVLSVLPGIQLRIDCVLTYDEGLAALMLGRHDVCLLDVDLRDTRTGIDLVREAARRGSTVPIVVVTGFSGAAVEAAAFAAGATAFLTKRMAHGDALSRALRHALGDRAGARGRARVLVVDDDPIVLRATVAMLRRRHDVTAVSDAREALLHLQRRGAFDVVLSDLMMPEMGGDAFYEAVRSSAPWALERIIFMTGGAFTPHAAAFLRQVPNRTLEKPIRLRALQAHIDEVCRRGDGTRRPSTGAG